MNNLWQTLLKNVRCLLHTRCELGLENGTVLVVGKNNDAFTLSLSTSCFTPSDSFPARITTRRISLSVESLPSLAWALRLPSALTWLRLRCCRLPALGLQQAQQPLSKLPIPAQVKEY